MNQLLNKYEFFCILLQEDVAKELGIPVECQRFWLWAKRQNHTYRPNRPLTEQEEAQTVWYLLNRDCGVTDQFLNP
jgi:hypothetical protein